MDDLIKAFVGYVSELTHKEVVTKRRPITEAPLFLSQRYDPYEVCILDQKFICIVLKGRDEFHPATFEKHLSLLQSIVDSRNGFVLLAQELSSHVRSRLMGRHISFVIPGRYMYWPELGIIIQDARSSRKTVVNKIHMSTQAVIISVLVAKPKSGVTQHQLSNTLGYSSMTISRAFREMKELHIGYQERNGKEIELNFPKGLYDLWQVALPFLKNPVKKIERVQSSIVPQDLKVKSGEPALAELTMLAHPSEPVYALSKSNWNKIDPVSNVVHFEGPNTCLVQQWAYDPLLLASNQVVDVFSLYLHLREVADDRIQIELENVISSAL